MPTRLPYLKGTSQFLTTGGDEEEEGGREEREGVNFSCRKLKASRGCITAEKFQQQQTNKAYINVCDLCFYVDKTGRFVVVVFFCWWWRGGGGGCFYDSSHPPCALGELPNNDRGAVQAVNHLINTNLFDLQVLRYFPLTFFSFFLQENHPTAPLPFPP